MLALACDVGPWRCCVDRGIKDSIHSFYSFRSPPRPDASLVVVQGIVVPFDLMRGVVLGRMIFVGKLVKCVEQPLQVFWA